MKKILARKLTPEAFAKYGSYNDILNPGSWPMQGDGIGLVSFFRDLSLANIDGATVGFSNTRVKKRDMTVQFIEQHSRTCEAMLILDNDCVIHLGIATPGGEYPVDQLEAFIVPKGTLVVVRPGVWHDAPYVLAAEEANVLIVLPERCYANDCEVYELPEGERPVIVTE